MQRNEGLGKSSRPDGGRMEEEEESKEEEEEKAEEEEEEKQEDEEEEVEEEEEDEKVDGGMGIRGPKSTANGQPRASQANKVSSAEAAL